MHSYRSNKRSNQTNDTQQRVTTDLSEYQANLGILIENLIAITSHV
jgi:hypothetical protein